MLQGDCTAEPHYTIVREAFARANGRTRKAVPKQLVYYPSAHCCWMALHANAAMALPFSGSVNLVRLLARLLGRVFGLSWDLQLHKTTSTQKKVIHAHPEYDWNEILQRLKGKRQTARLVWSTQALAIQLESEQRTESYSTRKPVSTCHLCYAEEIRLS